MAGFSSEQDRLAEWMSLVRVGSSDNLMHYSLSLHCMPGTELGAGKATRSKTKQDSWPLAVYSLARRQVLDKHTYLVIMITCNSKNLKVLRRKRTGCPERV